VEPDVVHKVGSCTQQTNSKANHALVWGAPACGAHRNRRSWGARGIESCPRVGRTRMWGASELALMGRMRCNGIGAHGAHACNGIGARGAHVVSKHALVWGAPACGAHRNRRSWGACVASSGSDYLIGTESERNRNGAERGVIGTVNGEWSC